MDDLARQSTDGQQALHRIFRYLSQVNDQLTPETFQNLTAKLLPETKDAIMTLAEQWEARGRADGEARGRAEGERKLLLRLLTLKFGELPDSARTRIESAAEDDLISWSERMLTAESLIDVLGG